jgi:hypothetical protein
MPEAVLEEKTIIQRPSRQKIDKWKAYLLWTNNHSFSDIALKYNCTPQAVQQALQPIIKTMLSPQEVSDYKKKKTDLLDSAECKLLGALIDDERIKKASVNNLAYAVQSINNINRLEKGLSTQNISVMDLTPQERDQLRELEAIDVPQYVVSEPIADVTVENNTNDINKLGEEFT